ncbi:retropepsin-like aspartic protease family protein [Pleomorphomonas koreensis]|uniref:retropepsin-like aspartic protease family protein n=1 Tax=Pleomorphomonas koreensis TaxID=257440 RepID=UPI00040F5CC3|nr:TIGR02281 family clan AA aspartic protease [Pleomorphomonas koreensis]
MARLVWLVLAATVVIGFLAPELQRLTVPRPASEASAPAPQAATPSGRVEIAADGRGHFLLTGRVNGRPLSLLADTGATLVALRASDARQAGLIVLPGDYTQKVDTAGGPASAARVRLQEVEIGDIRLDGVDALVLSDERLAISLLGMSFLGRLRAFSVENGRLVLSR